MSENDNDVPSTEALLFMAAHDLKAPLRSMHAFAEALGEDYAAQLDDTAREYVGYIAKGATDMRVLLDGMLAFARLGQNGVVFEDVSLGDVIAWVQADLRTEIQAVDAMVHTESEALTFATDQEILATLIRNLLANAIMFRAPGQAPQIKIDASETDAAVVISIADDGIGIPPDQVERVFQPFVRLMNEPAYAGAGLGLSSVKKAADLLGGEVLLQSTPNVGTVVTVTLPRIPAKSL